MDTLIPFLVAGAAALAIFLIAIGLAGRSSVDPVQARLTQLGSMQAKNLEELELQAPFFERTVRPLAGRLSGTATPLHVDFVHVEDREEPRPRRATPEICGSPEWLGMKVISAIGLRDRLLPRCLASSWEPGQSRQSLVPHSGRDRLHRSPSSGLAAGSGPASMRSCSRSLTPSTS